MNALIVYDSQFGNTERIALSMTEALRAFGQAQAMRVGQARTAELQGVDMLILGSPTQGWRATPAMLAFVQSIGADRLRELGVACFDTRFQKPRWLTGSAAVAMEKALQAKGASLVAPPESYFVQKSEGPLNSGELERAARWATALAQRTQPHPVAQR
jgi:flavodoxin